MESTERRHHPASLDSNGGPCHYHVRGHRRSIGRHSILPRFRYPNAGCRCGSPHRLRLFPVRRTFAISQRASIFKVLLLRFLGLNTVIAYQRAKVSAFKIVDHRNSDRDGDGASGDAVNVPIIGSQRSPLVASDNADTEQSEGSASSSRH